MKHMPRQQPRLFVSDPVSTLGETVAQNVKTQIQRALKQGPITGREGDLPRKFKLPKVNRQQLAEAIGELKSRRVISVSYNPETQQHTYRLRQS